MNPRLCQQIATKINRDKRKQNGVTAAQVLAIANDEDRCESHPVCQEIRIELKKHKV